MYVRTTRVRTIAISTTATGTWYYEYGNTNGTRVPWFPPVHHGVPLYVMVHVDVPWYVLLARVPLVCRYGIRTRINKHMVHDVRVRTTMVPFVGTYVCVYHWYTNGMQLQCILVCGAPPNSSQANSCYVRTSAWTDGHVQTNIISIKTSVPRYHGTMVHVY